MKKFLLLAGLLIACASTPAAPVASTTPDQYMSTDISGDNQADKISFTVHTPADGGMQTYTLQVNDAMVTANGDNLEGYFTLVDLDQYDSIKEIAVGNFGPSSDYNTDFYYYDGKQLVSMGNISGLAEYMTFDHNGTLTTQTRGSILHTWFYPDDYKLSADHLLVDQPKDLYEMNTAVTLKQPLTLQKSPTDPTPAYSLKSGDTATIVSSDNKEWCLVKNTAGAEGWFAIDDYEKIRGTDWLGSDVFDGLSYAD